MMFSINGLNKEGWISSWKLCLLIRCRSLSLVGSWTQPQCCIGCWFATSLVVPQKRRSCCQSWLLWMFLQQWRILLPLCGPGEDTMIVLPRFKLSFLMVLCCWKPLNLRWVKLRALTLRLLFVWHILDNNFRSMNDRSKKQFGGLANACWLRLKRLAWLHALQQLRRQQHPWR